MKKTNQEIEEYILGVVTDYVQGINIELKVTKESNLRTDLCFDSLDIVDVVREIELNLDIILYDEDFITIKTVQNLIDIIQKTYKEQNFKENE